MKISRDVLLGQPEPPLSPIEKLKQKMAMIGKNEDVSEPIIELPQEQVIEPLSEQTIEPLQEQVPELIQEQVSKDPKPVDIDLSQTIKLQLDEALKQSVLSDNTQESVIRPLVYNGQPLLFNEQVDPDQNQSDNQDSTLSEIPLSELESAVSIARPEKSRSEKKQNKFKNVFSNNTHLIIAIVVGIIVALGVGLVVYKLNTSPAKRSTAEAQAVTTQDVVKKLSESTTTKTSETTSSTDETNPETSQDIGGGYKLIITKYGAGTSSEYNDYSISKPEKVQEQINDEYAKKLQEQFKSEMPVINTTIKVKDPSKIKMETYKINDEYYTILLNESTPFGYIHSVNDIHTNTVTTYYIQEVHAE